MTKPIGAQGSAGGIFEIFGHKSVEEETNTTDKTFENMNVGSIYEFSIVGAETTISFTPEGVATAWSVELTTAGDSITWRYKMLEGQTTMRVQAAASITVQMRELI